MEDKDPPHQGDPNPASPVIDEWGFPVPPIPSWHSSEDPDDDMGYCTGDDPQDRW